jgi:hypothetical protein
MIRRHLKQIGAGVLAGALAMAAAGAAAAGKPQALIPAAAVRADLRLAVETVERSHPELSHSVGRRELERAARRIDRGLRQPMTLAQAWTALAQLNPVLADGHLFIGLPDWRGEAARFLAAGGGYFPYEVSVDPRGEVRIVSLLGGGATPLAGKLIRRINGRAARSVARDLLARAHGDTPAFRAALLSQRWWLFYGQVHGSPAAFDLDLDGPGRQVVPASRGTPAVLQRDASFERQFRCNVGPTGAVLTASTFSTPDPGRFFAFTHDCFARIAAAGATRLVIDVRANGGGDDDLWRDGLLRYIADHPYKHGSRYVKRVLQPGAPGEVAGQVVSGRIETAAYPPADEPLRFRGQVYVLVGAQTYSSAVLFSNVVQDYGFAKVAGVGGAVRTRQSGGVQSYKLPNTGLMLFYPRFVLDRPSGAATPALLQPDLPLADDPLHPQAAVDALLSATSSQFARPLASAKSPSS